MSGGNMKIGVFCLATWLGVAVLGDDPTNLVEILRNFQRQLDAQEQAGGGKAGVSVSGGVAGVGGATSVVDSVQVEGGVRVLTAGDVIAVEVMDEPAMSVKRAVIPAEGTVMMPLVGPVRVVGKTALEAAEVIRAVLAEDYLVNPRVRVEVLGSPERWFTILNQVRRPGRYAWTNSETIPLFRAIGMAGGTTRQADLSRITVRREVGGKAEVIRLDLKPPVRDPRATEFTVRSGDVVEVGAR
jgi:polysaccharide export outer membrane protein